MNPFTTRISSVLFALVVLCIGTWSVAGSLTPPGPPGPTMHSLEDVYGLIAGGLQAPGLPEGTTLFMRVGDLKGPDTAPDRTEDLVKLFGLRHRISNQVMVLGGRNVGEAVHEGFTVRKGIDKTSPALARLVCTGQIVPEVRLFFYRQMDRGPVMFQSLTLRDVFVAGVDVSAFEDVTFSYGSIEWHYTLYDPQGNPKGQVDEQCDVSR